MRRSLEAKSKREQFLESLVEVLTQVWEILSGKSGRRSTSRQHDMIRGIDMKMDTSEGDTYDDEGDIETGIDAELEGEVWARTLADWDDHSSRHHFWDP